MHPEDGPLTFDFLEEITRLNSEISELTSKRFYSRKKLLRLQKDLAWNIERQFLNLIVAANFNHALAKKK